jgi:pyridoxal phosphate-dependent aminotransferase EpsN
LENLGLEFVTEPRNCFSNRWLTPVLLNPESGKTPEEIRQTLEEHNIESSLLWKPLHLQPLFAGSLYFGDGLSERLFSRGLCLPSGSNLSEEDLDKVVQVLKRELEQG